MRNVENRRGKVIRRQIIGREECRNTDKGIHIGIFEYSPRIFLEVVRRFDILAQL